jgi:hypothetical protein
MIIHSGRLPDSMKPSIDFQALGELLRLQFRSGLGNLDPQVIAQLFQLDAH